MNHAVILLAHGARDPSWATPFEAVVARVRERAPEAMVRLAFLELMAPTLEEAANDLVARGCTQLAVVPAFLGMGGHVRRDVPAQVDALRARHAGIDWRLHPALGESPQVIAALADAALAAAALPPREEDKTPR